MDDEEDGEEDVEEDGEEDEADNDDDEENGQSAAPDLSESARGPNLVLVWQEREGTTVEQAARAGAGGGGVVEEVVMMLGEIGEVVVMVKEVRSLPSFYLYFNCLTSYILQKDSFIIITFYILSSHSPLFSSHFFHPKTYVTSPTLSTPEEGGREALHHLGGHPHHPCGL